MKVGIIGCGKICNAYFNGGKSASNLEVVACADLRHEAAEAAAEEHGCEALTVDELLACSDIELVVNLTIPRAHVEVGLAAIAAGKHVYSEKPFAVDIAEGQRLLDAAEAAGLRVGCAPDTFLGGGIQTARKALDDQWLGKPVGGVAVMACRGHESWHPSPAFYYDIGGGPMFDMGPYYLTALVNLLGPIKRIAGVTSKAFEERLATSEAAAGMRIPVRTPTHLTGAVEFVNGAVVTVIMSFDIWRHHMPCIEIHGTEGSMAVPDPNGTGGTVSLFRPQAQEWCDIPLAFPHNARMIGVVDMVNAIAHARPHRASGALAQHVLEAMAAFEASSQSGEHVTLTSTVERPAALPLGLREWHVD